MGFDAFLTIDGIDGESTDEKHAGWIEIIRFGIGVRQEVSATASSCGGASAERTDFSDFIIRKLLDKSSPKLALACAAGTHIDKIVVELCRNRQAAVHGIHDAKLHYQPGDHNQRQRCGGPIPR